MITLVPGARQPRSSPCRRSANNLVGLGIDNPLWDSTTFTKNRDRLLDGEVTSKFLTAVLSQDKIKRLLSSDHFSFDGTFAGSLGEPERVLSD
jgi:hypothetical protein